MGRPGRLTLFTALVGLWALARVQLGFDYGDGPHAVGLAMRLADGDRPFVDEMNVQVMGSWPAVPFVWLWTHTVGTDGIILASRAYFVLLSLLVAHVSWRAVAPVLGRGTVEHPLGEGGDRRPQEEAHGPHSVTPAMLST